MSGQRQKSPHELQNKRGGRYRPLQIILGTPGSATLPDWAEEVRSGQLGSGVGVSARRGVLRGVHTGAGALVLLPE